MIGAGVLRAEWTKFASVRATVVLALSMVVVAGGFGWVFGTAGARQYAEATMQERLDFQPLAAGTRGVFVVQLLVAALGVLIATTEYGSGTMRATLAAVGRRGRLVAAKSALTLLALLPISVACLGLTVVMSQAALAAGGAPSVTPGDPGAVRLLVFGPVMFMLLGLFGLALGLLLRGTAAAVNTSTAFLLVPVFAGSSPDVLRELLFTYWPNTAAFEAISGDGLPLWAGLGLLAGFVVAMLTAAYLAFGKRDA